MAISSASSFGLRRHSEGVQAELYKRSHLSVVWEGYGGGGVSAKAALGVQPQGGAHVWSAVLWAQGDPGKRAKGRWRSSCAGKRLPAPCPRPRGRPFGTSLLQSLSPVLFLVPLVLRESRGQEKPCPFPVLPEGLLRDKEVFLNLTGLTGSSSLTFSREERTWPSE